VPFFWTLMRPKRPADSSGPLHVLIYIFLLIITEYGSSVSTKSPASGTATVSESRLTLHVSSGEGARSRVRGDQCFSAIGEAEVPVLVRIVLCSNDASVAGIPAGRQVTSVLSTLCSSG
jgi:hypothetical protein